MTGPGDDDYINIHDHGAKPQKGVFTVENIMVHEDNYPEEKEGMAYSCGAHPWYLEEKDFESLIAKVRDYASLPVVIALGEAGFDRLRGAGNSLQVKAFRAHVEISEEMGKPLFIHCVKAWDEILRCHKEMKPEIPWIIHGFRGKPALAAQLLEKGFYLSPWVEWATGPHSLKTLRSVPLNRLFLETDGFDMSIGEVYRVVAEHLGLEVKALQQDLLDNFHSLFKNLHTP